MLEFWFDFASTYSYIAAMEIEQKCSTVGITLGWRPFALGPIFAMQGWDDSHFNLNPRRGAYMWRDLERLTLKRDLAWKKPSVFPRLSIYPLRIAAAIAGEPWAGEFIRGVFTANFGEDRDIADPGVVHSLLAEIGEDADAILQRATSEPHRGMLRANTDRAISLGICGAPNCVIGDEVFWGEETLDDAIDWALGKR